MKRLNLFILASVAAIGIVFTAHAATTHDKKEIRFNASTESPLDSRIRFFAFSQDKVYDLVIKAADQHTHIRLAPDEYLTEKPKLGDTIQWRMAGNEKNLYIKALVPDLSTSVSLVTNKRVYSLQIRSSDSVADTVQMVYWMYPDDEARFEMQGRAAEAAAKMAAITQAVKDSRTLRPSLGLDVNNLTTYKIEGDMPFKVRTMVADNKFTYLEIPPNTQDLPAIFIPGPDGKAIPVNYAVDGNWITIERVEPVFEMRLGALKLIATANKKDQK